MKKFLMWCDQESGAIETYASALIAALVILAGILAGLRWID